MSSLFTTEDIKGYMPDLQRKKGLSVASSRDQYFNALLMAAKMVIYLILIISPNVLLC